MGLIEARHGQIPPSRVADRDLGKTVVVRMDASILISHSDKEQATGTFKHTYGHHPLTVWCDNTGESLAFRLRPGNAGSNTASDHIEVLDEAIAQLPARHRRDLLVTVDGAGATLDLVRHLSALNAAPGRRVHYSVGFDLDERARTAITRVPKTVWEAVCDTDGQPRDPDDAGVAELTGLLRGSIYGDLLGNWPTDMRVISPPGTPQRRGAALAAGGGRRVALPADRHQHPHRAAVVPRSPPPPARPGRGPDPHRQGHRHPASAVDLLRDQPGLVHGGHDRRRPAVPAAAALPVRAPGPRRTQDTALPPAAHRRPPRPRPAQTEDQNTGNLALGPRAGSLLPHRLRPGPTLIPATHP